MLMLDGSPNMAVIRVAPARREAPPGTRRAPRTAGGAAARAALRDRLATIRSCDASGPVSLVACTYTVMMR